MKNFVAAWTKVMNLDRYDVGLGAAAWGVDLIGAARLRDEHRNGVRAQSGRRFTHRHTFSQSDRSGPS